MSQAAIPTAPNRATVPGDKWVRSVSPSQSVGKAARRILRARLQTVWHWLPLAAERSEEDAEYVHQLRIASRRAVESVRLFSGLMPEELYRDLRTRLRQIRLAADEARNWDVLSDVFRDCADVSDAGIIGAAVEDVKARRREAQQPIVAIYQTLAAERFDERTESLLERIQAERPAESKGSFRRHARRQLRAVVKQFLKAADADLSDVAALHNLRICTKKLRHSSPIPIGF